MKKYVIISFRLLIVFFLVLATTKNSVSQAQTSKLTSQDIWEKTISYHDPSGKWDTYQGKIQEVTVFPNNNVVNETIEINKPADYYLSTAFPAIGTIKRGMDKEKFFYSLNDDPNVAENIRNNWGLSESGIAMYKQFHTCHFGMPMHLKSTGMKIQENVNVVDFEGINCYELTFIGTPDQVINEIYNGKYVLYIDTKTYSLRGVKYEISGYPAMYTVRSKEIEVNGIKIPHIQSSYNVENNVFRSSSVNVPYTK